MSRAGITSPKLSFFCDLCLFTKIYVTYFAQSQFWWITDCVFNGKHLYLNFCPGKLTFTGLIRSKCYCFKIRIQQIVFYCPYLSRTNYIWLDNLNIKKNYRSKKFTVCHLYRSDHLLWSFCWCYCCSGIYQL